MNTELPSTRAEARRLKAQYYFTGKPCARGGVAKRYTSCALCQCPDCADAQRASHKLSPKKPMTPDQREEARLYSKRYHSENREAALAKMRERNRAYYLKNSDRIKAQALAYQLENAEARSAYKNEWAKRKAKTDPVYRMQQVSRRMVHRALGVAGQKKYKRTKDYLDYTSGQLARHLERQFAKGMSWENYGKWHIDHITSVSELVRKGEVDMRVINCLTNLRPIWATENMAKGGKSIFLL